MHRAGYHSRESIASELAWLRALRDDHIADVPVPKRSHDGLDIQQLYDPQHQVNHFVVMFEFLEGAEPQTSDFTTAFTQLGEVNARLHQHAKRWHPPREFSRRRWDLDELFGPQAIWGPWADAPGVTPQGRVLLDRAEKAIRSRMEIFGTDNDRFGLIHADLRLANLLVWHEKTRVIDFDDCGFGWWLYDLAAALSFLEDRADVPSLIDAWTTGYQKVARLDATDRTEIPTFMMMRRLALLAWVASHSETALAKSCGIPFTEKTYDLAEAFLSRTF